MRLMLNRLLVLIGLLSAIPGSTRAGVDVAAAECATITPSGPRATKGGTAYFNIQGKAIDDPKYSSFGVLDFPIPRAEPAARVEALKLSLTQSLARFSKDGNMKIFLAEAASAPAKLDGMKFDPAQADGIGDQIEGRVLVGSATFSKKKTGDVDVFRLTPDDATKSKLGELMAKGGTIRLIVCPDSPDVAATYFGTSQDDESRRPRLAIETVNP